MVFLTFFTSVWFHWSVCVDGTHIIWDVWDGCSLHVSTADCIELHLWMECISVLWWTWQRWGNAILASPNTSHKYQRAQDFLLKFLFHSETRFNAMPSGLAFLPAAVFFWDYCLVIVWFRPYSIAPVINVELITMYWVITSALVFWDCFDSFSSHCLLEGVFYM